MKKYKHLFFDLDGTLIDSKPGIFNSVRYTMDKLNILLNERPADLNPFIGPPLRDSFKVLFGFDDKKAELATEVYREYYGKQGMNEFVLYKGVADLLQRLSDSGYIISLVTSKAEVYARIIVEKAGLNHFFTMISGCEIDGTRSEKAELIQYTLHKHAIEASPAVLMIGDRYHDIRGAKLSGISSAGVLYGYGSKDELVREKPDLLIESLDAIYPALTE